MSEEIKDCQIVIQMSVEDFKMSMGRRPIDQGEFDRWSRLLREKLVKGHINWDMVYACTRDALRRNKSAPDGGLSYSNHCKEVDEKMETETQRKLDDYVALYDAISEKLDSDAAAIAILQELSKDRRSGEIRVERAAKSDEANANEPATEKQKKFMKKLNIAFPANVTKHEASTLLDEELARLGE